MMTLYPAAILAGGLATRLHPVTETIPKALIQINGAPFIDHQLLLLRLKGIRHVVLCVGFLGEAIQQHVGNGSRYGMHVEYSYDGPKLLGTGGALKRALALLGNTFFVMYGDSYLDCDYAGIQAAFDNNGKRGLMTVFHNNGLWDTSNVEYADGRIIEYNKRDLTPRMQHIDYGLGVFSYSALSLIPDNENYDLAQLYQTLLHDGQLAAFEVKQRFYEIGSFAGIKEIEYHLSQEKSAAACEQYAQ